MDFDIKSRFVRDRLKETSWEKRGYVHDLIRIEFLTIHGGLGWAAGMAGLPQKLYATYTAEAECIFRELREGRYVDSTTFHTGRETLVGEWTDRQAAKRDAERERRLEAAKISHEVELRRREAEREQWLRLGGGE